MAEIDETSENIRKMGQFFTREGFEILVTNIGRLLPVEVEERFTEKYQNIQGALQCILQEASEVYPIHVRNNMDVDKLIRLGDYCPRHKGINNRNFPETTPDKETIIRLIPPPDYTSAEEERAELSQSCDSVLEKNMLMLMYYLGYVPANIYELITFGNTYPNIKSEHVISTLGASYLDKKSNLYFPFLATENNSVQAMGLHRGDLRRNHLTMRLKPVLVRKPLLLAFTHK
jgi:hypothetical protein